MPPMNCRICRAAAGFAHVGAYARCAACGGFFLPDPPALPGNAPFSGAAAAHCEAADLVRKAYFRRRLDLALRHANVVSGPGRLVDVGCGAGILLADAAARGWQVAGVELSPELAARAQERVPTATIVTGDAVSGTEWPWPGAADVVIALDVLEHVVDPPALLQRCRAGLRPGGVLVVQTPNARSLRARWQKHRWPMLDPAQHLVLYPPVQLRHALREAGFVVETCQTVSGTSCEVGLSRIVAAAREAALSPGELGNAVLVVARAR